MWFTFLSQVGLWLSQTALGACAAPLDGFTGKITKRWVRVLGAVQRDFSSRPVFALVQGVLS